MTASNDYAEEGNSNNESDQVMFERGTASNDYAEEGNSDNESDQVMFKMGTACNDYAEEGNSDKGDQTMFKGKASNRYAGVEDNDKERADALENEDGQAGATTPQGAQA